MALARLFFALFGLWLLAGISHAQAASPDFGMLADADWQLVSHSPGIMVGGKSKTAIQVVFDPNCPASARLHEYLKKTHGATAIRWVPVAYYQKSSLGKAAALLQAPNPEQAQNRNFENYDYSAQMGAIEPIAPAIDFKLRLVTLKVRLDRWIGATPLIIVRTPDGQVLMNDLGNRAEHINRLIKMADGLKAY